MEVTCRRASHSIDPRAFNDGNIRFRNGHRAEKWLGDIQGKGGVRTNINGSITRRITWQTPVWVAAEYTVLFFICVNRVLTETTWSVVSLECRLPVMWF